MALAVRRAPAIRDPLVELTKGRTVTQTQGSDKRRTVLETQGTSLAKVVTALVKDPIASATQIRALEATALATPKTVMGTAPTLLATAR